jgi:hypothetical protein
VSDATAIIRCWKDEWEKMPEQYIKVEIQKFKNIINDILYCRYTFEEPVFVLKPVRFHELFRNQKQFAFFHQTLSDLYYIKSENKWNDEEFNSSYVNAIVKFLQVNNSRVLKTWSLTKIGQAFKDSYSMPFALDSITTRKKLREDLDALIAKQFSFLR